MSGMVGIVLLVGICSGCLLITGTAHPWSRRINELKEWGVFLLTGVVIAQVWANVDYASYHETLHNAWFQIHGIEVSLHFLVNEVFMLFFFGAVAKELAEAMNVGGVLHRRRAIPPFTAAFGGMVVPAAIYGCFCLFADEPQWSGLAVPCATDIAFGILVYEFAAATWPTTTRQLGRTFLLALAIVDDLLGMLVIALFYSEDGIAGFLTLRVWLWLSMSVGGVVLGLWLKHLAKSKVIFESWLPYLGPAVITWIGLHEAGLHPSLALVPIVMFCMPMYGRDEGIFAKGESERRHDTVNRFEHAVKSPVDIFLLFFGLANAGVPWVNGEASWTLFSTAVLLGLLVGKTIGIPISTWLIARLQGVRGAILFGTGPDGLRMPHLIVIGAAASMGFTVAIFVVVAGEDLPELKLGAIASFSAFALAKLLNIALIRPTKET
ncbi:MAG: Na+/H+ antiporter NhaA [Candidatus Buchananbacteria bacterium]|nr:Na+/H+ antiporter NhaA [Candidatus Buchananbacteria bacterium]